MQTILFLLFSIIIFVRQGYSIFISKEVNVTYNTAFVEVSDGNICCCNLYAKRYWIPFTVIARDCLNNQCKMCKSFYINDLLTHTWYLFYYYYPNGSHSYREFQTKHLTVNSQIKVGTNYLIYNIFHTLSEKITQCTFIITRNKVNIYQCKNNCENCKNFTYRSLIPATDYELYYKCKYMDKPRYDNATTLKDQYVKYITSYETKADVIIFTEGGSNCDVEFLTEVQPKFICKNNIDCRNCRSFTIDNLLPNGIYKFEYKTSAGNLIPKTFPTKSLKLKINISASCGKIKMTVENHINYTDHYCSYHILRENKFLMKCGIQDCISCNNYEIKSESSDKFALEYSTKLSSMIVKKKFFLGCTTINAGYVQKLLKIINIKLSIDTEYPNLEKCTMFLNSTDVKCSIDCYNNCTNFDLEVSAKAPFELIISSLNSEAPLKLIVNPMIVNFSLISIPNPHSATVLLTPNIVGAGICKIITLINETEVAAECFDGVCNNDCDNLNLHLIGLIPNSTIVIQINNPFTDFSEQYTFLTSEINSLITVTAYYTNATIKVVTNIEIYINVDLNIRDEFGIIYYPDCTKETKNNIELNCLLFNIYPERNYKISLKFQSGDTINIKNFVTEKLTVTENHIVNSLYCNIILKIVPYMIISCSVTYYKNENFSQTILEFADCSDILLLNLNSSTNYTVIITSNYFKNIEFSFTTPKLIFYLNYSQDKINEINIKFIHDASTFNDTCKFFTNVSHVTIKPQCPSCCKDFIATFSKRENFIIVVESDLQKRNISITIYPKQFSLNLEIHNLTAVSFILVMKPSLLESGLCQIKLKSSSESNLSENILINRVVKCDERNVEFIDVLDDTNLQIIVTNEYLSSPVNINFRTGLAQRILTFQSAYTSIQVYDNKNYINYKSCFVQIFLKQKVIPLSCGNNTECALCNKFKIKDLIPNTIYFILDAHLHGKYERNYTVHTNPLELSLSDQSSFTSSILQVHGSNDVIFNCSLRVISHHKTYFNISHINNCNKFIISKLIPGKYYKAILDATVIALPIVYNFKTASINMSIKETKRFDNRIDYEMILSEVSKEVVPCEIKFSTDNVSCLKICPKDCWRFSIIIQTRERFAIIISTPASLLPFNWVFDPEPLIMANVQSLTYNSAKITITHKNISDDCYWTLERNNINVEMMCNPQPCPKKCHSLVFELINLFRNSHYVIFAQKEGLSRRYITNFTTPNIVCELQFVNRSYNFITVGCKNFEFLKNIFDLECIFSVKNTEYIVKNRCERVIFGELQPDKFYYIQVKILLSEYYMILKISTALKIPLVKFVHQDNLETLLISIDNNTDVAYIGDIYIYRDTLKSPKLRKSLDSEVKTLYVNKRDRLVEVKILTNDFYTIEAIFSIFPHFCHDKEKNHECTLQYKTIVKICPSSLFELKTGSIEGSNHNRILNVTFDNRTFECNTGEIHFFILTVLLRKSKKLYMSTYSDIVQNISQNDKLSTIIFINKDELKINSTKLSTEIYKENVIINGMGNVVISIRFLVCDPKYCRSSENYEPQYVYPAKSYVSLIVFIITIVIVLGLGVFHIIQMGKLRKTETKHIYADISIYNTIENY